MSILTIDHISKYYNLDGTNQERALNDVTLEIAPGKITAIYGPSGCGKTSLLSIISGLDSQYQGNLYFKNQNMRDFSERDLTYFRKAHIGFVFQNFNLISHQSVLENVKMPLYVKNMTDKEMAEIAERELSRLGIGDFIKKNVKQLSGGQKRRVSIGIELLSPSPYFILDEPSSGLDALSDRNLLRTLKILAKSANKSIVVITHNTENLAIFDKIIFLSKGRPTFAGTYEELLLEYKTSDPYMIRKYMDMNIADVYQELNASTRIYKI